MYNLIQQIGENMLEFGARSEREKENGKRTRSIVNRLGVCRHGIVTIGGWSWIEGYKKGGGSGKIPDDKR